MAKITVVYENLADAGTVSATEEVSTLPATFLQQTHLTQVWRSTTTTASVILDLGTSQTIRCIALLGTNLSAAATVRVKMSDVGPDGSDVYNSGLLDPAGVDPNYGSFVHVLDQDYSARYVRLNLDDDSLSYLQAGRLVVGPAWVPEYNYDRSDFERFGVDNSRQEEAISGALWVESTPARRGVRFSLPGVSTAEVSVHLDAMLRVAGRRNAVLACINSEADNLGQETYYGLMTSAPSASQRGFGRYRQPIEVINSL